MSLRSHLTLAAAFVAGSLTLSAHASPIVGSFTFGSSNGTYMNGSASTGTATTATGLDFGTAASSPAGNGYGTNGTARITNQFGSFTGLTSASIADISLGSTANPYTANPFIAFTGSNIVLNFLNATISRTPLGVTVYGTATYADGVAADANTGTFSLSVNSQSGDPNNFNFSFTGNAGAPAVAVTPEPSSLALLGTGLIGAAGVALRRRKLTA